MKIVIQSTEHFREVDGVRCRLWAGVTEDGTECLLWVTMLAFEETADHAAIAEQLRTRPTPHQIGHATGFAGSEN